MLKVALNNCGNGLSRLPIRSLGVWALAIAALVFAARPAQAVTHTATFTTQSDLNTSYVDNDFCEVSTALAAELNTPVDLAEQRSSAGVKIMPAIPSAALMGLFGFACLTFVRDRKFWLLLAAGALSLSFWPIQNCSRLAANATARYAAAVTAGANTTSSQRVSLQNHRRTRADIDGTSYIALLRHLAGMPAPIFTQPSNHRTLISGYRCLVAFTAPAGRPAVFYDSQTAFNPRKAGPELGFWPGFCLNRLANAPPAAA